MQGFRYIVNQSLALLIALLVLTPTTSIAQTGAVGLSAFGIQSNGFQGINCKRFLRSVNHSKTPAIAILYKTFGTNNKCLKQFWNISRTRNIPHVTEIHFSNEVGRRNKVHDIHDFLTDVTVSQYNKMLEEMSPALKAQIVARAQEIVDLITPVQNTGTFILSTGLEDNYSLLAWQNIYQVLKEVWPFEIARSTLPRYMARQFSEMPAEIYIEYHGYRSKFNQPQRCIANGDGQDVNFLEGAGVEFLHAKPATFASVRTWMKRAAEKGCITFLWASKWQGIYGDGELSQPMKRTFRFDASDMNPIKRLLKPGGKTNTSIH